MVWEVKDFEDCLEKIKYTNKIKRKDFLESGRFPVVSQEQDYINGYWDDSQDVFKIIKPVIIFGDHTQVLKYIDFDFVLGADGVKILQPISNLNCKFFYYFLMSVNLKSLGYARHYRLLKEKLVPLPPLPEQKRIVAILDEAFENITKAKENAEKNLKNAKEIFESYLQSVFENKGEGWEAKMLEDVCELKHGFAFAGNDFNTDYGDDKPIVLTPGNFHESANLYFTPKNTKRYNGKILNEWMFNKGDLVVVMTDLSSQMKILGKPAFIDYENILHNQRIGRFIFKNEGINKRFIYYYLQTQAYLTKIKETATGTMVKHTAPKRILKNKIFIPSIHNQNIIVTKLDAISAETKKLESIYEKKLADLEELKSSILQKAFDGALK